MTEKIIFSKFSNDRAEQYCIVTEIIQDCENRFVRKRALNNKAQRHVKNIVLAEKKLNEIYSNSIFRANEIIASGDDYVDLKYIDGANFENILDSYLDKKDLDGLYIAISHFFEEMNKCEIQSFASTEGSEFYFGKHEELKNSPAVSYANLDHIFQNVIEDKNGCWNVIDYEWTVDCMVPVRFIQYRSLYLYVYGASKRHSLIENDIFARFGFTSDEIAVFDEMEQHFQAVIKDGHKQIGDYYHMLGKPAVPVGQIVNTMEESSRKKTIEVYYDDGTGFMEDKKYIYESFPVRIPVTRDIKALRIDPMRDSGIIKINKIVDSKNRKCVFKTNGVQEVENVYCFNQNDPGIILENKYVDTEYIYADVDIMLYDENESIINYIMNQIKILSVNNLKMQNELDVLKNQIKNNEYEKKKNQEIQLLNDTIEVLKQENMAIHSSLSWKLTAPMRGMVLMGYKLMRRFKVTSLIYDGLKYLFRYGIRSTYRRIKELYGRQDSVMDKDDFVLSEDVVKMQKNTRFAYEPKISILVPLYNTPEIFLQEMIESVQNQTYGNWELCLADGSDNEHTDVEKKCMNFCKTEARIKYKKLEKNLGISENTNACIEMASGDYIGLFDHDDLLTQDALYEVVKRINEKENVDVVYTDEDKLLYNAKDKSAKYVEPHCKSDFNLDLLRTNNYICHFFVVKRSILDQVGGFRSEYDGSQDFDLILRCVEKARGIEHIPKILYHWRIHAGSTAARPESKMYCYEAGKHAIESHLERLHINATVEMTEHLGFYRVKYPVTGHPLVSIIIPNKDEKETLEKCINSIKEKTKYDNYEIIVVENNSVTREIFDYYDQISKDDKVRVIRWENEFNYSKINNFGVQHANGEYLLLLNNDVEVISDCWMEELLSNCQREEVGIVGAKLIYPDNTVQHAGAIIGLGGIAGHAFVGLDANHPGYFGRAFIQQDLSAVTAACLMVSKKVYNEVGGLEEQLRVAFNDVDFCLKVRKAGYLVVMDPNARLYHYESKSRGAEDTPEKHARFASEVDYMAKHWRDILEKGDPYYNKNLTLIRGDFSMKAKDEVAPRYI